MIVDVSVVVVDHGGSIGEVTRVRLNPAVVRGSAVFEVSVSCGKTLLGVVYAGEIFRLDAGGGNRRL